MPPRKAPESPEQVAAFEAFFKMGNTRSIAKLSRLLKKNKNTLQKWYQKFKWEDRAERRSRKIAKEIEKKTDKDLIKQRTSYLSEIGFYRDALKDLLDTVIKKDPKTGKPKIMIIPESVKDVGIIIKAYEILTRLEMDVLKEDKDQNKDEGVHLTFVQQITVNGKTVEEEVKLESAPVVDEIEEATVVNES